MAKSVRYPETRDVRPRVILVFGIGLLVFVAVSALALGLIFDTAPLWRPVGIGAADDREGPELQTQPKADLAAFRRYEDEELGKLAWVDRIGGIARIPVEDAMKLLEANGLPDWSSPVATSHGPAGCDILERQVPRTPQAASCRTGGASTSAPAERPQPASDTSPSVSKAPETRP